VGDSDPWKRKVEFDRLNWMGKAIFLTGQVARAAGTVVETIVDQAGTLIGEAERAFREGIDGEIEDAKILDEHGKERTGETP
jgi:hypothetical protein